VRRDDPIERWRAEVAASRIPASAKTYALETLHAQLRAALEGAIEPEELSAELQPGAGTDRANRSLRVLHRTGHLGQAVGAYREAHTETYEGGTT
jgi:hypothetical protein